MEVEVVEEEVEEEEVVGVVLGMARKVALVGVGRLGVGLVTRVRALVP
jgi:hypothetical protein